MVRSQSKNSSSNKVAKELKDRRYHQRVVKSKKVYDRKKMKITAEIVNGKCPTCEEFTMLVGLTKEIYRCMNCGSDLEQYVNGKIVYLPHITKRAEFDIAVKDWTE